MSTDILVAIDGALQDFAVSGDAMRWNPRLSDAREAAVPPAPSFPALEITVDFSGFNAVIEQMGEALRQFGARAARAFGDMGPVLAVLAEHRIHTRLARIRCRECNPRGNPGPLAVNGHEYHRRRKARARRLR